MVGGQSTLLFEFQMLWTAKWLRHDVLMYWRYEQGNDWIRYPARERAGAAKIAFLFHRIHSQKCGAFHCDPFVKWPTERSVFLILNGELEI